LDQKYLLNQLNSALFIIPLDRTAIHLGVLAVAVVVEVDAVEAVAAVVEAAEDKNVST
jgi:hypothetical protein